MSMLKLPRYAAGVTEDQIRTVTCVERATEVTCITHLKDHSIYPSGSGKHSTRPRASTITYMYNKNGIPSSY
jgi:hypothetical protein